MIEIYHERDLVELENGRVTAFEYQFPVDTEQVKIDRHLLGLDGGQPALLSKKQKSQIATHLRNIGFLTNSEIEDLGGKVKLVEKEI